MPFLVAAVLVAAVHLVTAIGAWTGVGLLADDHQMIGAAVLRHRGAMSFSGMFVPEAAPDGQAAVALYRPFIDLAFWLEQPLFGVAAFGYHVTNSLLHCGVAMLWFVLVRRLSGSTLAGFATAVLFVGWPGHSEATHWIAARTNVLSTFLLSAALVVHQGALACRRPAARMAALAGAALLGVMALGTKESAIFVVPLAALLAWRAQSERRFARRCLAAGMLSMPMAGAALAWLAWRAHCIGTWGSGTAYGWKAARVGAQAVTDWMELLLAPAHRAYVPTWALWALAASSVVLLVLALIGLRAAAARTVLALGGLLTALGFAAGIGLEPLDRAALENVRYSYEAALGLCAMFGVGLAALGRRGFATLLIVTVSLYTFVLHQNRQSWLRVSANYARMRSDIVDIARATQQPLRVFDAPGVHDGAFGYLNGYTEFLFLQNVVPPDTNLRGAVSSTVEWPAALQELAAAARAKQMPAKSFVVQWHDGALAPHALDGQWPQEPWPGTTIGYARVARERPFAGTDLPVHVLVTTADQLTLSARAQFGDRSWSGPPRAVAAGSRGAAISLPLPLPESLLPDAAVNVVLVVGRGETERTFSLGVTVPAAR